MLEAARGYLEPWLAQGLEIGRDWITSPAAYAQFGLLVGAWLLAVTLAGIIGPRLRRLLDPGDATGIVARGRRMALLLLPLLMPLIAYGLTAAGESVTRSLFGSGAVIAFGKRVFIFIAVRIFVNRILTDPMLRRLGRAVLVPVAAVYALGLLQPLTDWLAATMVGVGNIRFSLLAVIRAVVVGGALFWLGRQSAETGTGYIRAQAELRPPTRELAAKAFEAAVYGAAFLVLVNVLGIDLTALAVLGGAIGLGLGFGLQTIAANFVSGVILLLEGQLTVGDYVELDDGRAGTIKALGARATTLQTFDGRLVVVPNDHFITSRVVNWTDGGTPNEFEVGFGVAYETDINRVPGVVEAAVAAHPGVLRDGAQAPECRLTGFGASSVDFTLSFWLERMDEHADTVTSEVRFAIWNALAAAGIEMPFPQQELRVRDVAGLAAGVAAALKGG
jgi:small-conductance mechanosensitive channel